MKLFNKIMLVLFTLNIVSFTVKSSEVEADNKSRTDAGTLTVRPVTAVTTGLDAGLIDRMISDLRIDEQVLGSKDAESRSAAYRQLFLAGGAAQTGQLAKAVITDQQHELGTHEARLNSLEDRIISTERLARKIDTDSSKISGAYVATKDLLTRQLEGLKAELDQLRGFLQEITKDNGAQKEINKSTENQLTALNQKIDALEKNLHETYNKIFASLDARISDQEKAFRDCLSRLSALEGAMSKMSFNSLALWIRQNVDRISSSYTDHKLAIFQLSLIGYIVCNYTQKLPTILKLPILPVLPLVSTLKYTFMANIISVSSNVLFKFAPHVELINDKIINLLKLINANKKTIGALAAIASLAYASKNFKKLDFSIPNFKLL